VYLLQRAQSGLGGITKRSGNSAGALCGVPVSSSSRFACLGDGLAEGDMNIFEGIPFKALDIVRLKSR